MQYIFLSYYDFNISLIKFKSNIRIYGLLCEFLGALLRGIFSGAVLASFLLEDLINAEGKELIILNYFIFL